MNSFDGSFIKNQGCAKAYAMLKLQKFQLIVQ